MKLIAIKQYKNALPALRAAEALRNKGVSASASAQYRVCIVAEGPVVDVEDILQLFRPEDYDFSYKGPRPRQGMAFNVVDPVHSRLLASLLDQAAVLAGLGSLFVDGRPAAPLFGGLAQQLRDQAAYDHGDPIPAIEALQP